MRQTCKVCDRDDYWNFTVPDRVWRSIVPVKFREKVVCLACFDRFATRRKVEYAASLENVSFAGDMAAFELLIVKRSNGPYLVNRPSNPDRSARLRSTFMADPRKLMLLRERIP